MLHRLVCHRPVWFVVAAAVGLGACNDTTTPPLPDPPPPPAGQMSVEVVDAPTGGVVNGPADAPVTVRVLNLDGSVASGAPVTFTLLNGGTVQNATATSDAAGLASPGEWVLGTKAGSQRLVARASGAPLSIDVVATTGPAASVYPPAGVDGSAQAFNQPVNTTFVVVDEFGNRSSAGLEVTFTALEGSISPNPRTVEADEAGAVSPGAWTLGAFAGPQRLVVEYEIDGEDFSDTVTVTSQCPVTELAGNSTVDGLWRTGVSCATATRFADTYTHMVTEASADAPQRIVTMSLANAPGQALQVLSGSTVVQDILPAYLLSTTADPYRINWGLGIGGYTISALAPGLSAALYELSIEDTGDEDGWNSPVPIAIGCAQGGDTPFLITAGIDVDVIRLPNGCGGQGGFGAAQDRFLLMMEAGDEIDLAYYEHTGNFSPIAGAPITLRIRDAATAGGAVLAGPAAPTATNGLVRLSFTAPADGLYEIIAARTTGTGRYNLFFE